MELTPRQFAYWLQGYFELSEETPSLNSTQTELIRETLNGVFIHIDATFPEQISPALDKAHNKKEDWNPYTERC